MKKSINFLVIAKNLDTYLKLVDKHNIRGKSTFVQKDSDRKEIYDQIKNNDGLFYQVTTKDITKIGDLKEWYLEKNKVHTKEQIKDKLRLEIIAVTDNKIGKNLLNDLDKNIILENTNDRIFLYENFLNIFKSGFDLDTSKKISFFLLDESKNNRYYETEIIIKMWKNYMEDIKNEK